MTFSQSQISFSPSPYSMYVESIGDISKQHFVFIHGGYHTGVCWMMTPDGRNGWAADLAQRGLYVHVTDMPGFGRSGFVDFEKINGKFIVQAYKQFLESLDGEVILITHSMSGPYGLKLAEILSQKIRALIMIEPALPGNLQPAIVPYFESDLEVKAKLKNIDFILDMQRASPAPQSLIENFTKTGSKQFPNDHDARLQYQNSLQALYPRLMYERLNIQNSQLVIEDYDGMKNTRFLVVTGPLNPIHLDDDKKIVDWLIQHDIDATYYQLDKQGIEGNGHMMMIEKNNVEILELILKWLNV